MLSMMPRIPAASGVGDAGDVAGAGEAGAGAAGEAGAGAEPADGAGAAEASAADAAGPPTSPPPPEIFVLSMVIPSQTECASRGGGVGWG